MNAIGCSESVQFYVQVGAITHRGSNAKKQAKAAETNRYASRIEQAANRLIQAQQEAIRSYHWMEISEESDVPYEIVRDLGFSIDCGSNGFTAIRPGLSNEDYQKAMRG
ncbi:MAG: hypothetical protein ACKVIS_06645 [Pseudomonadales bacterium]